MKVSIITPCLNSEKTIWETIESVLNQTYKNIEYIIVDGGSTDSTMDIIKKYYPKFRGRMRFISEKDKGIYDAMNKGIKMSKGSLIGIINSDDYYELDAVENIINHITDDRYQVIYGYCRMKQENRTLRIIKSRHENLKFEMIPHETCFASREVYRDFGIYLTTFKITNDYELMVRLYKSGKVRFTQVQQILVNFRIGGISSDKKRTEREKAIIAYYHGMVSFRTMIKRFIYNI